MQSLAIRVKEALTPGFIPSSNGKMSKAHKKIKHRRGVCCTHITRRHIRYACEATVVAERVLPLG